MHTIKSINGTPTLMSGSKPLSAPMFDLFYDQALKDNVVSKLYNEGGIRSFAIRNFIGTGDRKETRVTIDLAVKRISNVASIAAKADILIDCLFYPADEWLLKNPHECYITSDSQVLVMGRQANVEGVDKRRDYIKVPGPELADCKGKKINGEKAEDIYKRRRVSPFSEKYAGNCVKSLQKMIVKLDKKNLTSHIWGIFLENYNCGEWNLGMYTPDYSRVAVKGFRKYLKEKYKNKTALQKAWNNPEINFSNVMPPENYIHGTASLGSFSLSNQAQIDYIEAEARALSKQFLIISKAVRKINKRFACGGFYPGISRPQSDCLAVYKDKSTDFLATPLAYENRSIGSGVNSQSIFCDSFSSNGKVWFDELDTRTNAAKSEYCKHYGGGSSVKDTVEMLWRDAGQMLVRGHHGWWLDFGGAPNHKERLHHTVPPHCWHLSPEVLKFHNDFAGVWKNIRKYNRKSPDQIKVLTPSYGSKLCSTLSTQQHVEWTLAGVPVEYEILENILKGKAAPGKLNIIYASTILQEEEIKKLKNFFAKKRASVIWFQNPALAADGREINPELSSQVTGFAQKLINLGTPYEAEAEFTASGKKIFKKTGLKVIGQLNKKLLTYHPTYKKREQGFAKVASKYKVDIHDPDCTKIAAYTDGGTAVALRQENNRFEMIYNLPVINSEFLREAARQSGCNIYAENNDVIYASKGLILLYTTYKGKHTITLPQKGTLTDLRTGKVLVKNKKSLSVTLGRGKCLLLKYEK